MWWFWRTRTNKTELQSRFSREKLLFALLTTLYRERIYEMKIFDVPNNTLRFGGWCEFWRRFFSYFSVGFESKLWIFHSVKYGFNDNIGFFTFKFVFKIIGSPREMSVIHLHSFIHSCIRVNSKTLEQRQFMWFEYFQLIGNKCLF